MFGERVYRTANKEATTTTRYDVLYMLNKVSWFTAQMLYEKKKMFQIFFLGSSSFSSFSSLFFFCLSSELLFLIFGAKKRDTP